MDSARFRRATVDNSGRSSVNIFVPDTESQIHAQPHEPESSSQRVYGSNYSGASFLNTTSIEEFVSKYQVIKVSWRGKYERILALAPTRFCTIDPKDFEVTNTWSLTALLSVHLDASDPDGFVLTMKGPKKDEQLKLRCRFRSRLLLDLYRLKQYQQRDVRPGASFQCHKWSRKGTTFSCTLTVWMDCVTVEQLGVVRSKYIYTEMEYLALLTDSQDGLAFGYTGRDKLIFSQQREKVFRCIQAAADAIGCKIPAKADLTAEKVQESRAVYGLNVGEPFVQFHVKKITQKYSEPRQRIISLHEKYFVELDWDGKVIACYKYLDIYMLVRETKTVNQFEIQFCNEQVRTYLTDDRDGILTAFYDICATCEENPELFISCILNQRGLRMLPFFAVEGVTETQQFFNGSSIGNWYLQRMGSVGKLKNYLDGGDRGFVEIVAEFNANVPVSGIPYYTKSPLIADALRPMCAQLYYVAKTTPVPERAAITILQALFRISSSYYGFREIGQAGQISKTIANLLINGKEFVVFWTTLLLRRMTTHTPPTSINLDVSSVKYCEEVESQNKQVLFSNTNLTQALITHLEDIDVDPYSKSSAHRPMAGPLVMMGTLQILEACLCSRATTTGPTEFMRMVEGVIKFHSTLLKVLVQSRCASITEACTLLLKTTLEECQPDVALEIRDQALTEGIVLKHFYQGLFDESFNQRCVSRYLVSVWMSHHDRSRQLLSRIIPSGFIYLLKQPLCTPTQIEDYDRIEREVRQIEWEECLLENKEHDSISFSSKSTFHDGSCGGFKKTESFEDAGTQLEIISQEEVPSMDDMDIEHTEPSVNPEICSPNKLSRLIQNCGNEAPIKNEHSKARMLKKLDGTSKQSSNYLRRGSKPRKSASFANPTPRLRKRDVALSFLGALGGKRSSSLYKQSSREKHNSVRSARPQENFCLLFHMMSINHETVDLIWNKTTREELRRALLTEIERFSRFQLTIRGMNARWNYEDFSVSYPSLVHEIAVAGCYIKKLAHLHSKVSCFGSVTQEDCFITLTPELVPIREPAAILTALYVRLLRENIQAECRGDLETSILCIKSMGVVAGAHARNVNAVDFEDVGHLWTLMNRTVHASMLMSYLQTMRAMCLHRKNASRVLSNSHQNVMLAIQLLQFLHTTYRDISDTSKLKKLWILVPDGGEECGPFGVNELKQKLDNDQTDMSSIWVTRQDDPSCEPLTSKTKVMEIAQLRWEVGISGVMHPVQIAHDAASILLSIARCNSLLSDSNMPCGHSESPIFPLPRGQTTILKYVRQIIPVLLRNNHPELWEKVAVLLELLYSDREVNAETEAHQNLLFVWGFFYMAFLGKTSDFRAMAGLLKVTHRRERGFHGTSALKDILPQGMIDLLDNSSPSVFAKVFCEGERSPKVIWNPKMRKDLQALCFIHMEDYADVLREDMSRAWNFCPMAPVAYDEISQELWCGGFYLGEFCEKKNCAVSNPSDFVGKLTLEWRTEAARKKSSITVVQARQILGVIDEGSLVAALRRGFKEKARALKQADIDYTKRLHELREAYYVLTCPRTTLLSAGHDPQNLLLLLLTLNIVYTRYSEQLIDNKFVAYDLLLPLLDAHGQYPPEGATKLQALKILVSAAELVYNTCIVSAINQELLLEQSWLVVLERVVNFCVDSMVKCEVATNLKLQKVSLYLLQTFTELLTSPRCLNYVAGSTTLSVDMVQILWLWNHADRSLLLFKITEQVLIGISKMAELETNQNCLVKLGVLWQLFLLFSRYDVDIDDVTARARLKNSFDAKEKEFAVVAVEAQNQLAILAVRALCRLGGLLAEECELRTSIHSTVKHVANALMTPNLADLLLLSSHHEFLKLYHGECESYTLYWNYEMRQEQLSFLSPRAKIKPNISIDEQYVDAIEFRFMYLADLLYIGGLYIEMLMNSLLVFERSHVTTPLTNLGLTDNFFKELFIFVDSGELIYPDFVDEEGNEQRHLPYAGWKIEEERRKSTDRITALKCLSITTSVASALVERYLVVNSSALKTLLRLLFPPDNEVHQIEDIAQSLQHTPQLYVSCLSHCIATLEVLSTLDDFGTASLEIGICDILIELVHIRDVVGPEALRIIRNLCSNGAALKCNSEILRTGVYLEFIGWMLLAEKTTGDNDFDATERLRLPSAMILSEMVKDGAPLYVESRRALCRFFPTAIVRILASNPETSMEYIMGDHMTPELVWDDRFRNHQRNCLINYLDIYFSSTSTTETEDGNFMSVVDSFEIDYSGLYVAPMVGNVYLELYMENPTFELYDPLHFMTCLLSEFEILFKQLAHMSSALRETIAREDDEMIQRDIDMIDLVGSSLVCLLQVETSLLENAAEMDIPAKCCEYLNGTVRSQACEPCVVNVVRILRVCTLSRTCVASIQPMCSTLLSCLMAITNPVRGGPLHFESAFVLEIMRRVVSNYPEHGGQDASVSIVYLAGRLDLFGFLLNILENPNVIGKVKEPHIVRAQAIEILNILEKDRVQGSYAHQILKKHKKWQKSYRHEATDVIMSWCADDPFLKYLYPKADAIMREYSNVNSR